MVVHLIIITDLLKNHVIVIVSALIRLSLSAFQKSKRIGLTGNIEKEILIFSQNFYQTHHLTTVHTYPLGINGSCWIVHINSVILLTVDMFWPASADKWLSAPSLLLNRV